MASSYHDMATEPLREAGIDYRIEHGGKHVVVCWGERRYTMAATPSDSYRGCINARADIRRMLREDGVIRDRGLEPVVLAGAEAMADSRDVAEWFEKRHADVLRSIRTLTERIGSDPRCKFTPIIVNDLSGSTTSHVLMNRNAFALLAMGFTGQKAIDWKLAYLSQFDRMEAFIREGVAGAVWEMQARMAALEAENERLRGDFEALADLRLEVSPVAPVVIRKQRFVRPSLMRRLAA